MVVTQLVKRSLPTPEVQGLNPVIGKFFYRTFVCQLYRKYKNKDKEDENGPFLKTLKLFKRAVNI